MPAHGVFRVPLAYFLPGSLVNVYIRQKTFDANLMLLFSNIKDIFNKCSNDLNLDQGIRSQIVELNSDFYTAVDI